MTAGHIRPGRTAVAATLGGLMGGGLLAGTVGFIVLPVLPDDRSGLAELGVVLFAFDAGVLVGAATALGYAFRDEPARTPVLTIATVLSTAAVIGFGAWRDWIDAGLLFPPLVLAVTPLLALLGRLIATGGDRGRNAD